MNTKTINAFFITLFIAVFAISLNVLVTLSLSEGHIGIRVAATDFLIPLMLLLFVIKAIQEKRIVDLILPWGWTLLVTMTIWMGFSLVNGYYYTGSMTTWALVNKFIGWFALMAYFVAGVYLGGAKTNLQLVFFRSLFITSWLVCLSQIIVFWCFLYGFFHEYSYVAQYYRMAGFYQNPNAFGIFLCAIFMLHLYAAREGRIFRRSIIIIGAVLTLFCIFHTFSRSAWLGLFLALFIPAILDRKLIPMIMIIFLVTFTMNFLVFSAKARDVNIQFVEYLYNQVQAATSGRDATVEREQDKRHASGEKTSPPASSKKTAQTARPDTPARPGVQALFRLRPKWMEDTMAIRSKIIKYSFAYWREHPVIGIGLGGFLWSSRNTDLPPAAYLMHNSVNWLLVETGIIGLLIFSTFVLLSLKHFYLVRHKQDHLISTNAMIGVIMVMIGASVGTEVIYQRYFWLLLGLFLVLPSRAKEQTQANT